MYMQGINRLLIYLLGLGFLSLGSVLNVKTGLGVSPIMSIPYIISRVTSMDLGAAAFIIFTTCVIGQVLLLRKKFQFSQFLQIPMSILFCSIVNFYNDVIIIHLDHPIYNMLLLVLSILLTGTGVAMMLQMNIVPAAPDGLTKSISDKFGIKLGISKNMVDIFNVLVTIVISMVFIGKIHGIGIGTLIAGIGTGRVIAMVNQLFQNKLLGLSGLAGAEK